MRIECFMFYSKASQNNNTIYFSICYHSAANTRSIRPLKLSTVAHNFCYGVFAHTFTKDTFNYSTVVCVERQASVSNKDQTLKSIGLRSGDEGDHNSLLQKRRKLSLHQAWVLFEVWEGAPSCRMVDSSFLKCSFISCKAGAKISMYIFVLTFATCFTKIRGDFQVFNTAAQTMTASGGD